MKTDPKLGLEVNKHLIKLGIETPMKDTGIISAGKQFIIKQKMTDIMVALGLDLTDDSLKDTPARVAKMYVDEIFLGLNYNEFPKCTTVDNKMNYDEMVLEKNINISSTCEHHFVGIYGVGHIAYIPNKKVLGLSKLNRVARYFSKRPQIQERLTEQICAALSFILDTDNVAVIIDARHFCVASRGIEDTSSSTVTSKLGGRFKEDPALRAEFISLIKE